jgi:hypothetical protein
MAFWAGSGGAVPPGRLVEQAFQALAEGLPERGALRQITVPQLTVPQPTGPQLTASQLTGPELTELQITGNVTDRKESH